MLVFLIGLVSAITTITDDSASLTGNITTTGNVTSNYFIGDGSLLTGITGDNSSWNESYADTLYADISVTGGNSSWNQTFADTLYAAIGSTSYISLWTLGNFGGSLYTTGADSSLSDSNSLFQVIGSDGTPRFQIQNGGTEQASFIARSFMVVNQNNTRLNQSQNNLCSEWGFNHLDCNSSTTGADMGVQDDFQAQGLIFANEGFRAHSSAHGAYLVLLDQGLKYSGGNGSYNVENQYFCDYDADNFVDTGGWIILIGQNTEYENSPADLGTFINSSCYQLKNNPSWNENITNMDWKVINNPVNIVTKGGFSEFYVGDDEQSKFEIKIANGTGSEGFEVSDTAGADQHSASLFKTNVLGFNGIKAIYSLVYSSVVTESSDSKNLNLEFDARNFNNSHHTFIQGNILGEKREAMEIDLISVEGDFDNFITSGQTDVISKAYLDYRNGTILDVTTAIKDKSVDISLFELDDSILYIGSTTNFTEIGISLESGGSKSITAFYYYCNATGWVSATGVSDSTGGFRNSGTISAGNPSDRATCSNAIDTDYSSFGTAFANTTNYTYIAIRRTQNNLITKPVENLISISGASQSFILSDDYIKLHGISAPPITCDATVDGAIYYDSDVKYHCSCNAVNWVRMSDPTDQTGCS